MAHSHPIYDTDRHFSINPYTRKIEIQSDYSKLNLMQNDHNCERFTFDIPREIEGHDMTLCNRVQIHYINNGTSESYSDIYEVKDLKLHPDDGELAVFSWLLSQKSTGIAGGLSFMIHFACVENNVIQYAWHTDIYTNVKILAIINNTACVVEQNADILEQWRSELFKDEGTPISEYTGIPYISKETVIGGYINSSTGAFIQDASFNFELFKIDNSILHEVNFTADSNFAFMGTVKNWDADSKSATPVIDIIQCKSRQFITTPECEYVYVVHTSTLDVKNAINLKIDGYNVMKNIVEHIAKLNETAPTSLFNPFKGKKISIFGDSISTFDGFLTPSTNITFYKTTDDYNTGVVSHRYTWWQKICTLHQAIFEVNNSYSNSCINSLLIKNGVEKTQAYAFINRVEDNDLGSPDYIFICGGTNDDFQNDLNPDYTIVNLGDITDYSGLTTSTDFTDDVKNTFKGAFAYVIVRLKELYPNAQIVNISYSALRSATGVKGAMAEICDAYDVKNVVLSGVETVDSIHPTKEGMSTFYKQVVMAFGVTPENDSLFDEFITSQLTAKQIGALDALFKACAYVENVSDKYKAFKDAFGIKTVDIPSTGISISNNSLLVQLNQQATIIASVTPIDTTDTISWVSSDESVAKVNSGVVTGVGEGICTITATIGRYSASCNINVSAIEDFEIVRVITQNEIQRCSVGETAAGLGNGPYTSTGNNKRFAYVKWDIPAEGGYTYKLCFDTIETAPAMLGSFEVYNQTVMDSVNANKNISLSGMQESVWGNSGLEFTPVSPFNNAEIKTMRLIFRHSDNSEVSNEIEIVEARVYKKKVQ